MMTSEMDIYAQTSSCQREGRFLIRFVEEYAVIVQGAKPRSQNTERCSRSGLFSGYFGLPKAGDVSPAQHIPQHGVHLQSLALNPGEGARGWQGFVAGTLPAPGGG